MMPPGVHDLCIFTYASVFAHVPWHDGLSQQGA